jgi:hypothetical protein
MNKLQQLKKILDAVANFFTKDLTPPQKPKAKVSKPRAKK